MHGLLYTVLTVDSDLFNFKMKIFDLGLLESRNTKFDIPSQQSSSGLRSSGYASFSHVSSRYSLTPKVSIMCMGLH